MKKAFVFLYVTILLALTGCKAELPRLESVPNSSSNPTVVAPSASGGSIHFHRWQEATCTQPKTCSICGKTKGVATGHIYNNNATCYICGQEKRENEKKEYDKNGNLIYEEYVDIRNEKIVIFYSHGLEEKKLIYSYNGQLRHETEWHILADSDGLKSIKKAEKRYGAFQQLVYSYECLDPNTPNTYTEISLHSPPGGAELYEKCMYANGRIILWEHYFEDGTIKYCEKYTYFDSGELNTRTHYGKDMRFDNRQEYDIAGNLLFCAYMTYYENGFKESYTETGPEGWLLLMENYWENGNLKTRRKMPTETAAGEYSSYLEDGTERDNYIYDHSGAILSGVVLSANSRDEFADGHLLSTTAYYANSNIQSYIEYDPEKNILLQVHYWENGNLKMRHKMPTETAAGEYSRYLEDGTECDNYTYDCSGAILSGVRISEGVSYDENGVLIDQYVVNSQYLDGNLIQETYYFSDGVVKQWKYALMKDTAERYIQSFVSYLADGSLKEWYEKDDTGRIINGWISAGTWQYENMQGSRFEEYRNGLLVSKIDQYASGLIRKASYYTYNKAGQLLTERFCQENSTIWERNYSYDDNGRILSEVHVQEGKSWEQTWTYSHAGNLLEERKTEENGNYWCRTYRYSDKGTLLDSVLMEHKELVSLYSVYEDIYTYYRNDGTVSKRSNYVASTQKLYQEEDYDEQGRKVVHRSYPCVVQLTDNTSFQVSYFLWHTYTYYDNNCTRTKTSYNPDGTKDVHYEYFYDEDKLLIKEISTKGIDSTCREYDSAGNEISEMVYYNGILDHGWRYVYNEKSQIIEETFIWSDGHYAVYVYHDVKYSQYRTVYEYDSTGRLLSEEYQDGGSVGIKLYDTVYWYEYIYDGEGKLIDKIYHANA